MKPDTAPIIYSFIIRFVVEDPPREEKQSSYHGSIRHIQSAEEMYFNEWEEAVEFMSRYIPIKVSDRPKPTMKRR